MKRKILILTEKQPVFHVPQGLEVCFLPHGSRAERLKEMADAEIVFGEPTAEELQNAPCLRWVQLSWAGADRYQNVVFPHAVKLTTASGAFGQTIAEHAMAMLLSLCRRLPAYDRQCDWLDLGPEKQVSGKTALIFGAGDIGTHIAKLMKAVDVHTVGVCRKTDAARTYFDELIPLYAAETRLHRADFVLCALPHTAETKGYFDRRRLDLLSDDAVLVNVGRGSLIDTQALCDVLSAGKLFGVGLDVTEPEPLPPKHPLRQFPNVIITPHVAGVSFGHLPETEEQIFHIFTENLDCYLSGRPLRNQVMF